MSSNHHILHAAKHLVEAINKSIDVDLPQEIADIVKTHATGAAAAGVGAGWIPGAGGLAMAAISAGFIWTMYGRINSKIGLPMTDNLVKSLATGVATNLATGFVGALIVQTIFSLFPGIGSIGASAVAGGTGYALTVGSGYVYLKLLTKLFISGKDPTKMDESSLKKAAHDVTENENVNEVMSAAKAAYKKTG